VKSSSALHYSADTLFGATYMVLAPEHELVDVVTSDEQRAAVQRMSSRPGTGATSTARRKPRRRRVCSRRLRHQPGERRAHPDRIADYVLMGYAPSDHGRARPRPPRLVFALSSTCRSCRWSAPGNEDWAGYVGDASR
jgi:leucyl-tRNA synthetase